MCKNDRILITLPLNKRLNPGNVFCHSGKTRLYLPVSNYEELKIVCTNCNFITVQGFGTDCKKHIPTIFGRINGHKKEAETEERERGDTKERASKCLPYSSPNNVTVTKSPRLRRVANKTHTMKMTKRQQGISK